MTNENKNPIAAIDTLLDTDKTNSDGIKVYPITMGRYALLELLESPFITSGKEFKLNTLVPSFYVMTQDYTKLKGYNSKNINDLYEKSMEWAETLDVDDSRLLIEEIFDKLGLMKKVSPNATDEDIKTKKEEAQAETVS